MQSEQENQTDSGAVLKFDHNVIEHLGVKLYQNKVLNVLAELVANCWDADAKTVTVTVGNGSIAISDSGVGMDYHIIRDRYLVIGIPKRGSPNERSPGYRLLMGRKASANSLRLG
jgi:hypothetical protein